MHETNDKYHYKIGVCVDVDDAHPDCAVMQYEQDGGQRGFCAGKVNTAQVARSKLSRNVVQVCNDMMCVGVFR